MATSVAVRWKILIVVALTVTGIDQWTKFLAVKNLTPGIAQAGSQQRGPLSQEKQAEQLAQMGLGEQLGAFYGKVKHPCRPVTSRCPSKTFVDGFWNWRYVQNPGAAWGLLAKASESIRIPFFILVSIAAVVFILSFFRKLQDTQLLLITSLSLVFGGAIGNLIDRLHLSYVIDFIDWYVGTYHWPTFNFADAAISCGVGLLVIEWIRDAIRAKKGDANSDMPAEETS